MWANHLPPQFCGSTTLPQSTDYRELANRYLQFGTDTNFVGGVFVPPQNQKSVDEVTTSMLREIQCLRRQPSGASTVASSPLLSRNRLHDHPLFPNPQESIPREKSPNDAQRRNYDTSLINTRVTKRQREKLTDGSGHPPRAKRRKPCSDVAPGEKKRNLTEAEKRSNHIESEQKRRDQISESFNAMVRLVPELRNSRHSKSEKLRLACTWLESMVADNEEIGAILASTEPMVGESQFLSQIIVQLMIILASSKLVSDVFPRKPLNFVSPLTTKPYPQKLINKAEPPTPTFVHPFILVCPSARMEWSDGVCVCMNGAGVDVLPFTERGEYVEMRDKMPSHDWKKNRNRKKTSSIPMHDTSSKGTLRSLNYWFYWLPCIPPFAKNLAFEALVLTSSS